MYKRQVFIPYKQDAEGTIVNDEYFGKIPADMLIKENGIIYFKIDGLYPVSYTHLDVYKRQIIYFSEYFKKVVQFLDRLLKVMLEI